jgi:hypothetical protein
MDDCPMRGGDCDTAIVKEAPGVCSAYVLRIESPYPFMSAFESSSLSDASSVLEVFSHRKLDGLF